MLPCFASNISSALSLELETVLSLCEIIDTPRSLTVWLLLANMEWQQYMDLTIDAGQYQDVSNFADDYLVTEVLRKSPSIPLGVDRADIALQAFNTAEESCKHTNVKLRSGDDPEWIFSFRRHIAKLLGPLDKLALDQIQDNFRFGPGASTGVRGIGSVRSDKYDEEIHLTANLVPFYRCILGDTWWEHHASGATIVQGNKFTTVPKTAKTDRGICVEPTLNMYVQLGVGAAIRRRLKTVGIDLNKQQSVNRDLAKKAYDCNLATIDLSAASDSLCTEIVWRYFPERWVHLFDVSRSTHVRLPDGSYHLLEKVSSMGNGFTFELESLLFYAVCKTFVPFNELDQVSVYGDDIICPSKYAPAVIDALEFLGFSVNERKSFLAGNFFESCGTDWFKGQNVRPFYLKGGSGNIPYALQIANKLRLYASRVCGFQYCDRRFQPVWVSLKQRIPKVWKRCLVPPALGDTGLIVSKHEAFNKIPARDGFEGHAVHYMALRPVNKRKTTIGLLLSVLAKRTTQPLPRFDRLDLETLDCYVCADPVIPTFGREPIRGYLGKHKTRLAVVSQWPSGLDWGM